MHDVEKFNLRQAGEWLAGEIEIRIPKKWLAFGAVAFAALVLLALD